MVFGPTVARAQVGPMHKTFILKDRTMGLDLGPPNLGHLRGWPKVRSHNEMCYICAHTVSIFISCGSVFNIDSFLYEHTMANILNILDLVYRRRMRRERVFRNRDDPLQKYTDQVRHLYKQY